MNPLFRKEWRATRLPFLIGAVAAVALMGISALVRLPALSVVVWLGAQALGANLVGASLFCSEVSEGTLHFLLAQPLRRGAIWRSKVLVGFLELAVLMLLLTGALILFSFGASFGPGAPVPEKIVLALLQWTLPLFSCSVLCSVLMDRTITAVLAGYCLFAVLFYLMAAASAGDLDKYAPQGTPLDLLNVIGTSVLLLLASLLVFIRKQVSS